MVDKYHSYILLISVGATAWLGTAIICRYAKKFGLIEVPNHRSSHIRPTPYGGGLAIVAGGTLGGGWITWNQGLETGITVILSLLIASIGLWDDIRQLSVRTRLVIQIALCSLLIWALIIQPRWSNSPIEQFFIHKEYGTAFISLYLLGAVLFAGVWWLNLFNFMDGIDGIACSQALFMLIAAIALSTWQRPEFAGSILWLWMLTITTATIVFLLYNWPPAQIFMGNVGSLYLAFMIYALALISIEEGWLLSSTWIILGAAFITDATVTLITRILTGQAWYQAHRSHVYQRLARHWQSHRLVTILTICINLFWLAPLAWLDLARPDLKWACMSLAYLPLLLGAIIQGAGKPEIV